MCWGKVWEGEQNTRLAISCPVWEEDEVLQNAVMLSKWADKESILSKPAFLQQRSTFQIYSPKVFLCLWAAAAGLWVVNVWFPCKHFLSLGKACPMHGFGKQFKKKGTKGPAGKKKACVHREWTLRQHTLTDRETVGRSQGWRCGVHYFAAIAHGRDILRRWPWRTKMGGNELLKSSFNNPMPQIVSSVKYYQSASHLMGKNNT